MAPTDMSLIDELTAERDALAKEVERLRNALTQSIATVKELLAEVERLKGLLMEDVMQGPDAPGPEAAEGG